MTPAAGFVTPMSALIIGLLSGSVCYVMVARVKHIFGYDDTLDAFGIHGIGGAIGAVMTGVLATSVINPMFKDVTGVATAVGGIDGNWMQVVNQLAGIGIAIVLSSIGTFGILKVVDLVIGLRVNESDEISGLDASQHGETAYVFEPDSYPPNAVAAFSADDGDVELNTTMAATSH